MGSHTVYITGTLNHMLEMMIQCTNYINGMGSHTVYITGTLNHMLEMMIQCTNYINGMGSHNVRKLYVPKLCFTLA